jgi:hypothetical protein
MKCQGQDYPRLTIAKMLLYEKKTIEINILKPVFVNSLSSASATDLHSSFPLKSVTGILQLS